jgi:hypothetical protein
MKKLLIIFAVIGTSFSLLMMSAPAFAQADAKKSKQQTLSFEDELVEGESQKPELAYLLQKRNFNYKKLIKLRENFLPEMRRTSEDVQRARGGN